MNAFKHFLHIGKRKWSLIKKEITYTLISFE